MKYLIWGAILVASLMQQDLFGLSEGTELVFGVLPRNLAYHVVLSVVIAALWFAACRVCWPAGLDRQTVPAGQPPAPREGGDA